MPSTNDIDQDFLATHISQLLLRQPSKTNWIKSASNHSRASSVVSTGFSEPPFDAVGFAHVQPLLEPHTGQSRLDHHVSRTRSQERHGSESGASSSTGTSFSGESNPDGRPSSPFTSARHYAKRGSIDSEAPMSPRVTFTTSFGSSTLRRTRTSVRWDTDSDPLARSLSVRSLPTDQSSSGENTDLRGPNLFSPWNFPSGDVAEKDFALDVSPLGSPGERSGSTYRDGLLLAVPNEEKDDGESSSGSSAANGGNTTVASPRQKLTRSATSPVAAQGLRSMNSKERTTIRMFPSEPLPRSATLEASTSKVDPRPTLVPIGDDGRTFRFVTRTESKANVVPLAGKLDDSAKASSVTKEKVRGEPEPNSNAAPQKSTKSLPEAHFMDDVNARLNETALIEQVKAGGNTQGRRSTHQERQAADDDLGTGASTLVQKANAIGLNWLSKPRRPSEGQGSLTTTSTNSCSTALTSLNGSDIEASEASTEISTPDTPRSMSYKVEDPGEQMLEGTNPGDDKVINSPVSANSPRTLSL
ncbi:hypothetical protein IE53DRAFT_359356 [Violaceomyces palustris]|uniref:Uncharacterized protein n=1 Tax=Violaceomyces palustris TaxID=1673888 RepID=A0ACD0P889_9BASI|nr:hypothetical protein IE53DRAFT_359356 [Violaceomyces palustris]